MMDSKRRSIKWWHLPISGMVFGAIIGLALSIMLHISHDLILSAPRAIIAGIIWGLVFGMLNAGFVGFIYAQSIDPNAWSTQIIRPPIKFSFAINFCLMALLNFFWFIPVPNLGYVFFLSATAGTLAALMTWKITHNYRR